RATSFTRSVPPRTWSRATNGSRCRHTRCLSTGSGSCTGRALERPKGSKAQRPKGPKAQRPKGAKAQRRKGAKAQRRKGTKRRSRFGYGGAGALFEHEVLVGRAAIELLALTCRPPHFDCLIRRRSAQPEVQSRVALREITRPTEHLAVQPPAIHLHTYARAQRIDVRPPDALHHQPVAQRRDVLEDRRRFAHVHDDDFERAVVVEIADSRSTR